MGGQVAVPHIERVGHPAVTAVPRTRGGLEQGRALPQHLVVVRAHARDPRSPGGREFVEVAAPLGRVAAHQCQVLRGEHHRTQHTEHLARGADR